jgi:hypothetical protein
MFQAKNLSAKMILNGAYSVDLQNLLTDLSDFVNESKMLELTVLRNNKAVKSYNTVNIQKSDSNLTVP